MSKIIFFDGDCALCNASMRFIIRRDKHKQLQYEPLQSESAKVHLLKFASDSDISNTILFIDEGVLYSKSDAALRISKYLSAPSKYLYLLRFIPRVIRDFIYIFIAKNRYKWFGKTQSCALWIETDGTKKTNS